MLESAYCDCTQLVTFKFSSQLLSDDELDVVINDLAKTLVNLLKKYKVDYDQVELWNVFEGYVIEYRVLLRVHGLVNIDLDEEDQTLIETTAVGIPDIQTKDFDKLNLDNLEIEIGDLEYGDEIVCDGADENMLDEDIDPFSF